MIFNMMAFLEEKGKSILLLCCTLYVFADVNILEFVRFNMIREGMLSHNMWILLNLMIKSPILSTSFCYNFFFFLQKRTFICLIFWLSLVLCYWSTWFGFGVIWAHKYKCETILTCKLQNMIYILTSSHF